MDELKRILAKTSEDRTSEEIKYLLDHYSELSEEQLKQLSEEKELIECKGVIPFKKTPTADKNMPWDGPAQMMACDGDMMMIKTICAWFDSESPDSKDSYKMPHHMAEGENEVVWKGVKAAMGALMGARGGVNMPEGDKKGVYNHLSKHYAQFNETPPEMKSYSQEELVELGFEEDTKAVDDETIIAKDNLGKLVRLSFDDIKIEALENGLLRAIVNSGQQDRHGEVLDIKGLSIAEYMKNPILCNGHDYSKPSVGRTHKLTKTRDGQLIADFEFATNIDNYNEPKVLDQLYRQKFQFAFSIGFIPEEMAGNTYTKSVMLEFSPVLIPADGNALLLAKQKGIDTDILLGYSKKEMNIKELLEKLTKGEELTIGELKFLNEKADELTPTQLKAVKKAEGEEETVVNNDIAETLKTLSTSIEELKAAADKVVIKDIATGIKGSDGNVLTLGKETPKEEVFRLWVKGMVTKDFSDYKSYMNAVGKSAMNSSDDGAVVPPTDFIAEVMRLEEQYGVARKYATVRNTTHNSITVVNGSDDVVIYDTAEAGAKKSTKIGYDPQVLTFRKFAAILPITDELLEDSAVDLWNDATNRFARAYAKQEDTLVFTQVAGGAGVNAGILTVAGTNEVVITGNSIEDLSFDDLSNAIYGIPQPSLENGRFYFHHSILGVIQRIKDNEDRYIWQQAPSNGSEPTIWGKPYTFAEALPSLQEDDSNKPFIVFGDLSYTTLGQRTQLTAKIFDTGSVLDPDDDQSELNLMTQDMQAMRVVKRMNAKVRFPAAFSVIATGPNGS